MPSIMSSPIGCRYGVARDLQLAEHARVPGSARSTVYSGSIWRNVTT
jgi:hypothetical protein